MSSRGASLAVLLLLTLVVLAPVVAAEAELADGGEDGGGFLGVAAAVTVSAAGGLAAVNRVRRRTVLPSLKGHPKAIRWVQTLHKELALPLHAWVGVVALVLSILHGLTAPRTNLLLTGGFVLLALVAVGGMAVRWVPLKGRARRWAYSLHMRWSLTAVAAIALILGHVGMVGD